jgi:hypothetical protein
VWWTVADNFPKVCAAAFVLLFLVAVFWRDEWACKFGRHGWGLDSGVCQDGWLWTTHRCVRCGAWHNPYMKAGVELHNSRPNRGEYALNVDGSVSEHAR